MSHSFNYYLNSDNYQISTPSLDFSPRFRLRYSVLHWPSPSDRLLYFLSPVLPIFPLLVGSLSNHLIQKPMRHLSLTCPPVPSFLPDPTQQTLISLQPALLSSNPFLLCCHPSLNKFMNTVCQEPV